LVFAAGIVVAIPLYLAHGHQWFFLDDWDFLAHRSLTSVHDLVSPHNEHWSTLPIIAYRVLWSVVGLHYPPYEIVTIALHLTAAFLLRKIMLRSGVDVWIATAAALLFAFLGSGRGDIVFAFQIGFEGSLVFGLAHLILADHDGPLDGRDALGLGFGVLGLLCSGVAVTMTIVVGLAVLIRRGWRAAALHTLPLAAIYGVWYAAIGHEGYTGASATIGELRAFTQTALANVFTRIGQIWGVGVLLALVLVSGLVLAWAKLPYADFRRRAAAPAALLAGAVVFTVIAGYGRVGLGLADAAKASRYVHLLAAMTLPAIAVAADAIARRWRPLYPVMLVLLLIGIPGNINAIEPHGSDLFARGNEQLVLAMAHSPYVRRVPASTPVESPGLLYVTAGWLADGAASGRIPKPAHPSPQLTAAATLALVVHTTTAPVSVRDCRALTRPVTVDANSGDVYAFRDAAVGVSVPLPSGVPSAPRTFPAGSSVVVEGGPLTVVFRPAASASQTATICRGL
jgi:hypothetical protein